MAGISDKAIKSNYAENKYRFGGKEQQSKEFSDKAGLNWDDYGARMYDIQIGKWTTIDPLLENSRPWTPYNYVYNNPIVVTDRDGRSGEVSIDKEKKTITITSNFIFYGNGASDKLAKETAADIQTMWNGANGKVTIDKVEYSVVFVVTGEYKAGLTEKEVDENKDYKNNYYKVVTSGIQVSNSDNDLFHRGGANSGVFLKSEIDGPNTTTEAHEYGHTLGAYPEFFDGHPKNLDYRGKGRPGIMYPKGTLVDAEYTYEPSKGASENGTAGSTVNGMNPGVRRANQSDINSLGINQLKLDKNGKANIGLLSNKFH